MGSSSCFHLSLSRHFLVKVVVLMSVLIDFFTIIVGGVPVAVSRVGPCCCLTCVSCVVWVPVPV